MDKDISNILCTKVDEHAGDWPSESFLELFRIAKKCVEPKMSVRPEINDVSHCTCAITNLASIILYRTLLDGYRCVISLSLSSSSPLFILVSPPFPYLPPPPPPPPLPL